MFINNAVSPTVPAVTTATSAPKATRLRPHRDLVSSLMGQFRLGFRWIEGRLLVCSSGPSQPCPFSVAHRPVTVHAPLTSFWRRPLHVVVHQRSRRDRVPARGVRAGMQLGRLERTTIAVVSGIPTCITSWVAEIRRPCPETGGGVIRVSLTTVYAAALHIVRGRPGRLPGRSAISS